MNTHASDTTKDVVLFINDFYPELAPAVEKLSQRLGRPLRPIMLVDRTARENGLTFIDPKHQFEEILCDFNDPAALRRTIKELEDRLLLIDGNSERSQPYYQLMLPHAPYVPGPTQTSLEWATHKGQMRQLMGAYNPDLVPHVQIVHDDTDETVASVLSNLTLPCIVKPTGLAGSMLVNKVTSEEELRAVLQESFAAIRTIYAREGGRWEPEMIVEEFMEGDMYSVDAYVSQTGQIWTLPPIRCKTAHAMGMDGFYEYQNETDLTLDAAAIKAAQDTAAQGMRAVGLRASTAHVELYLTANGWKIIELGPRPGAWRQFYYESAYGINHTYNELLVKMGLDPEELNDTPKAYSMLANTYSETEGILEVIEGMEEVTKLASYAESSTSYRPGDLVLPSGKGGKVVVAVCLSNTDKQQLLRDAEQVRALLNVRLTATDTLEATQEVS